ncbi:hypothetical protein BHE97_02950 [Aeromicrobium sp. PE09-221]|uniref:hypothetical protein n=1 Tax=Aeromicrobium sp. PE09-221 TaxID=1898043 RepID=UPI000B3EB0ED|nr:hypothetical protein [Aeromicrobium sp. PE09-221]OUZ12164.1 hypothetical protein BHE97_02950 [Aeromicrobium sp. PE09-221]
MPEIQVVSTGSAEEFAAPGPYNAPAAYWFWHRLPTPEEIVAQVRDMRDAGYQSFQIQTRMSFPLEEYLSDEYLKLCRLAADEAAGHGMVVGIYDEYNWLSGHAGGRVVEGHDHLRERHLFHVAVPGTAGRVTARIDGIRPQDVAYLLDAGMNWVFEGGSPRWDDWTLVAAVVRDGADVHEVSAAATITEATEAGCALAADLTGETLGDDAEFVFFVSARCASSRMINYLDPAAAERFTEVGYAPYAQAFGEHLGTTVQYAFFDQPHACFFTWEQNPGVIAATLMYDADFYAELESEVGRRWPAMLASLAGDIGDATAALRAEFFERYAGRAIDSFFGTLRRWCDDHGVLLTGHEVLAHVSSWDPTGTIIADDPRTNFGLDYFGVDAWRQITAVDARNEYPQLPATFGDSVARAHGRSGCIVEQYFGRVVPGSHFAAGWWELTLAQLRSQTLRHFAFGARQILMHAYWLTDGHEGEEMFTNPRFDFAPGVNFEPWFGYHRAYAEETARVSVFLDGMEPLNEVAVLYPLRTAWFGGPEHEFGEHTAFWTEHLARDGVGYHLVDERDLRAAVIADGGLRLPHGRAYRVLVLPGVEVLRDDRTLEVLEAFVASGGCVFSTGVTPRATQAAGHEEVIAERVAQLRESPSWIAWEEQPDWASAVRPRVFAAIPSGPRIDDESGVEGQLWTRRGHGPGGLRAMAFNDAEHARPVVVRPGTLHSRVRRWDPSTGIVEDWHGADESFSITLGPGEVLLAEIEPTGETAPERRFLVDGWTVEIEGAEVVVDPARGWECQGFETFSGIGTYRTSVTLDETDRSWELVLPVVHGSAAVSVNGRKLRELPWAPGRVLIPETTLRRGENLIEIQVASSAANAYYRGTGQQGDGLAPSGLGAVPVLVPAVTPSATHRKD